MTMMMKTLKIEISKFCDSLWFRIFFVYNEGKQMCNVLISQLIAELGIY